MGEFQRPIQSSKVTYKPVLNIFQFSPKKKNRNKTRIISVINTQRPQFSLMALKHAILKVRRQTKIVD